MERTTEVETLRDSLVFSSLKYVTVLVPLHVFFHIYLNNHISWAAVNALPLSGLNVLQVSQVLLWFWWRRNLWWWIYRLRGGPSSRRLTWCHYTVQPSPARTTSPPSHSNYGKECKLQEPSKTHTTPRRYARICMHKYRNIKLRSHVVELNHSPGREYSNQVLWTEIFWGKC